MSIHDERNLKDGIALLFFLSLHQVACPLASREITCLVCIDSVVYGFSEIAESGLFMGATIRGLAANDATDLDRYLAQQKTYVLLCAMADFVHGARNCELKIFWGCHDK